MLPAPQDPCMTSTQLVCACWELLVHLTPGIPSCSADPSSWEHWTGDGREAEGSWPAGAILRWLQTLLWQVLKAERTLLKEGLLGSLLTM